MIERKRLGFLDLCRILAVAGVFIGHKFYGDLTRISQLDSAHVVFRDFVDFLKPFCHGGGFGVVLFFCVSGYIIRYVLESENWKEFFIKRFFRIFPLYWTAVILYYFLTPEDARPSLRALFVQLTLLGDFVNSPYALNGVEWTLRVEMLFYLLMGILKFSGLLDSKHHLILSSGLFLVTLLLFVFPDWPANKSWSDGYVSIYSPFLFVGIFFRELEKDNISKTLFLIFVVSTMVMYCYSIQLVQPNWINDRFAILGVLVFGALYWKRMDVVLPPWAFLLSELTYGMYLFHNWLFDIICRFFHFTHFPRIFSIALLILFCWIVNRVIEKPCIAIGRKFIHRLYT